MQFAGKVAFVTNAGTGIGRAVALAFAREGARVAVIGITPADNDETVRLAAEQGGQAVAITCDTTDELQVQAAIVQTVGAFGRLDFAFNNAGLEPHNASTAALTIDQWNRIVNDQLRGTFLCMKYQIPLIIEQGGGAIVNTSSGTGLVGVRNNAAYYAAQHGIIGMTCLAALNHTFQNLRINAICPNVVDTPTMGRLMGRPGQAREKAVQEVPVDWAGLPEEMANAAVWLCSQGSSSAMSHALVADGGKVIVF